jgi:hypothetical protein
MKNTLGFFALIDAKSTRKAAKRKAFTFGNPVIGLPKVAGIRLLSYPPTDKQYQ